MIKQKSYIIVSILFVLSSCTGGEKKSSINVVQISGGSHSQNEIRGVGMMIDDTTLVTSAHVFVNDGIAYSIKRGDTRFPLTIIERDEVRDRAILGIGKNAKNQKKTLKEIFTSQNQRIHVGDAVSVLVFRSGSTQELEGKILDPQGKILSYTSFGQVRILSGIILTDIDALPGDSGAPVFLSDGTLVDVVHVRRGKELE